MRKLDIIVKAKEMNYDGDGDHIEYKGIKTFRNDTDRKYNTRTLIMDSFNGYRQFKKLEEDT